MKIINEPIKVMVIFHPNKKLERGKIQLIKFRFKDKVVPVQKVTKIYEENIVGNKRIVFVCQQLNGDMYELKYEIDSKDWYLFKK
ncbi:MAG TPA: hypothetical protein GX396_01450 [Tissierellia bacterium]|jgi:hypothetical protein|nr:hypothetical protein [Tissierellia bacterium]